jgi:hypothetical protein
VHKTSGAWVCISSIPHRIQIYPFAAPTNNLSQKSASDESEEKEKEKEHKRQRALAERQSQVQTQKQQLAQNIDRSRAGLEREGGEESFRYVPLLEPSDL